MQPFLSTTFQEAINIQQSLCRQALVGYWSPPPVIQYNTHLDTVWAQFWRPAFPLGQKYRESPVRAHTGLCLLIHHCTSARFRESHDFTVTARGGHRWPPAGVTARTSTDTRFNGCAATAAVEWTTDWGETVEDRNWEERGQCDLHARERESRRSLSGGRWAAWRAAIKRREVYETTRVTRRRRLTGRAATKLDLLPQAHSRTLALSAHTDRPRQATRRPRNRASL